MTSDRRDKGSHRIPIRFTDADDEAESAETTPADMDTGNEDMEMMSAEELDEFLAEDEPVSEETSGGPATAELIATRAELKRVDRERGETYNRVVADVATKLLPVVDNLKRALEAEASVESSESDEFRHFLSGVDLIYKQLNGVLDALGVKPIAAVGEPFDPHIHEAVVTEATDDFAPDTVMQEIVAGYRLGDKLIRPALVKVATRK
jgi:molecular chaperone GrpE